MNRPALNIAASVEPRAIPSLPPVRGERQASLILPAWASTAKARSLLTAIKAERPHVRVHDASGFQVRQYAGRNAAQLRDLFDRTFHMMIQDADAHRDALVSWRKANNADELIRRVLGDYA